MKQLLTTISFILLTITIFAQETEAIENIITDDIIIGSGFINKTFTSDFQELIFKYENYCNELVIDTVKQTGAINYELVPVDLNGSTIRMQMVNPDTIWNKLVCPTYKETDRGLQWGSIIRYDSTSYNLFYTNDNSKHITRSAICYVKRREINPFSDKFWDWIKLQ